MEAINRINWVRKEQCEIQMQTITHQNSLFGLAKGTGNQAAV